MHSLRTGQGNVLLGDAWATAKDVYTMKVDHYHIQELAKRVAQLDGHDERDAKKIQLIKEMHHNGELDKDGNYMYQDIRSVCDITDILHSIRSQDGKMLAKVHS